MAKHSNSNKLNCKIGDRLQIKKNLYTSPDVAENGELVAAGSVYTVVGLVGYGWDLELDSGNGPKELRIMNSTVLDIATITK